MLRVLTSHEGWSITLFSQSDLISQLCPQCFENMKYHALGKINWVRWCFFVMFACEKLFPSVMSFVDPLLSTALHSSVHRMLAFVRWPFVLVEIYKVMFHLTEDKHLYETHSLKWYNRKLFCVLRDVFCKNLTSFPRCVILVNTPN